MDTSSPHHLITSSSADYTLFERPPSMWRLPVVLDCVRRISGAVAKRRPTLRAGPAGRGGFDSVRQDPDGPRLERDLAVTAGLQVLF